MKFRQRKSVIINCFIVAYYLFMLFQSSTLSFIIAPSMEIEPVKSSVRMFEMTEIFFEVFIICSLTFIQAGFFDECISCQPTTSESSDEHSDAAEIREIIELSFIEASNANDRQSQERLFIDGLMTELSEYLPPSTEMTSYYLDLTGA